MSEGLLFCRSWLSENTKSLSEVMESRNDKSEYLCSDVELNELNVLLLNLGSFVMTEPEFSLTGDSSLLFISCGCCGCRSTVVFEFRTVATLILLDVAESVSGLSVSSSELASAREFSLSSSGELRL